MALIPKSSLQSFAFGMAYLDVQIKVQAAFGQFNVRGFRFAHFLRL